MNISPFQPGDKVVAYCRYSGGEEQGLKNTSTDEQEAAIRKFCEENGLILIRVYADPFVSGRSTKGREHYLEMMSDLCQKKKKKPDVKGLIAWDFERLHRNMDQAQLDAARLRMAGYKIYSLQQPVMDNGPFARVLEAMYFASAQNQSDMISADVKRALQHNFLKYKTLPRSSIGWGWTPVEVDMGFFTDGRPRSGYRAEPDPEKADLIRQAVNLRLSGGSLKECRYLLGMKTNWRVQRLFSNPLLFGQMTYGAATMDDYCDPIISREDFARLQVQEEKSRTRQKGRQGGWSARTPMLSGMLYCAECGGPMYLYRRTSKGHLYEKYYCESSCFRGVNKDELESLVIRMVADELTPGKLAASREAFPRLWEGSADYAEREQERVRIRLGELDEQINNITDAIARGIYSEALTVKLQALETERRTLITPVTEKPAKSSADALYEQVCRVSGSVRALLLSEASDDLTKKTALETCVRSILVDSTGKVQISMFLPGTSASVGGSSGGTVQAPPEEEGIILLLTGWLKSFTQ